MSSLPLTDQIDKLLARANERAEAGDMREALELRQETKKLRAEVTNAALKNAEAGAVINLSDLIGAAEQIHVDGLGR
jgi:hypothetical protein